MTDWESAASAARELPEILSVTLDWANNSTYKPNTTTAPIISPFTYTPSPSLLPAEVPAKMPAPKTRIVRLYIVDPDDNLPVDRRLLYKSDEMFTDLTNEELFFEIDVKRILTEHNEYRQTLKERRPDVGREPRQLEPIRIRDLRMPVVTIAEF